MTMLGIAGWRWIPVIILLCCGKSSNLSTFIPVIPFFAITNFFTKSDLGCSYALTKIYGSCNIVKNYFIQKKRFHYVAEEKNFQNPKAERCQGLLVVTFFVKLRWAIFLL
eukprot:NODE_91_length_21557_cov_0.766660.p19 type:complete len:110 gc:universal NODE_91_length_21557_cov_0.766660:20709-21038(+)